MGRRRELEKVRDDRAEVLGMLSDMRGPLYKLLTEQSVTQESYFNPDPYHQIVKELTGIIGFEQFEAGTGLFHMLRVILCVTSPVQRLNDPAFTGIRDFMRPSRLTLIWPNLILSPLVVLYACKYVYASRVSLLDMVTEAWDTIRGFWKGWLVDPLKDVLRTVRTGGEDGVIVQREALAADLFVSFCHFFPLPVKKR
jgi:nuclear control of ATPase protein 2